MPLTGEERQKLLALKQAGGLGTSGQQSGIFYPSQVPQASRPGGGGFFGSETAQRVFPMAGQMIGGIKSVPTAIRGMALGARLLAPFGLAGIATGAAIGGVGGALLPPVVGALTGEATRQVGQLSEGQPVAGQLKRFLNTGRTALSTEAIGAGVSGSIKAAVPVVAAGTRFLGRLFPGIPKQAMQRVFERGADKVVRPEFANQPNQEVPNAIRERVVNGVNSYRENFQSAYDMAKNRIRPILSRVSESVLPIASRFSAKLKQMRVIQPQGAAKRIPTVLPASLARDTASDKSILSGVLRTLNQFGKRPVQANRILDLIDEIDDMVVYKPGQVRAIGDKTGAALKSLRHDLMELIGRRVPSLRRANAAYSSAIRVYESIQPRMKDPVIDSTILGIGRGGNQFSFRELSKIDDALPVGQKFMDDLLDFDAGREFFKPSRLLSTPLVSMQGALGGLAAVGGYQAGGAPGAIATVGMGAALTTPRIWGEAIRVVQNLVKAGRIPAKVAEKMFPGILTGFSLETNEVNR